jgi:hypothetical protein
MFQPRLCIYLEKKYSVTLRVYNLLIESGAILIRFNNKSSHI